MASKREQVYRIPGAQNEDGQSGTLVMTMRRGAQDTVEFEADQDTADQGAADQGSSAGQSQPTDPPPPGEAGPEQPEQPGDSPTAGQLPAHPEDDPSATDPDEPQVEHR